MNRPAFLLPLLLLAGCGSGSPDAGDKADPVALVRTALVTSGTASGQTIIYGVAEPGPDGSRTLLAPAEAIVERIVAPTGTPVVTGQVILMLKPSRTSATDFAKAEADAAATTAAYRRTLRLRADGLVSDGDVETARAAATTAEAIRANLGIARGGTALRAPMAGIVQGLNAKGGDQVAAGATVATIAAKGNLRAHFGVDPSIAQRVRPGSSLQLGTVSGDARATVQVTGVDTQIDTYTRLAALYARIPDQLGASPGEVLRGSLSLSSRPGGLIIPYAALLDDGGHSYVFVIRGGVAHQQPVSPGNSAGNDIQILSGLAPGDEIVTEGGTALEDGMKVRKR